MTNVPEFVQIGVTEIFDELDLIQNEPVHGYNRKLKNLIYPI